MIGGRIGGYASTLDCMGKNDWLNFKIDIIIIEDMKVIDWGEVIEDYD